LKNTILLLFVILPCLVVSQQHPLAVESATLLESGHAQFDFGVSHFRRQPFPLSGLTGNLSKFGNIRFCISLSEYVELQTEGTLLNILDITERLPAFNSANVVSSNPTADIGDFSVWTKFGVMNEYVSGFGFSVQFGIQLPNASNESGLGVDEMNFYSSLLLQKHFAGKWTANIGLGILGDPAKVGQQHDVLIYGMEYSLPVGESTYLLLQTAGRTGHEGIGIHDLANAKLGLEMTFGDVSLKGFGVSNFSSADKSKGIGFSASYDFQIIDFKR
jgi:hypothetical protein